MKMKITETNIQIIPENAQDIVYIERYLGLMNENDSIKCTRINAMGLSCIAYLKIKPETNHEIRNN